jgi:flagellar biosynthesis protein
MQEPDQIRESQGKADKKKRQKAVALLFDPSKDNAPRVTASGEGAVAEKILQLAFASGVKVREDAALADMLSMVELESEIPTEALVAVAEILSYVYRLNGKIRQVKEQAQRDRENNA